MTQKITIRQGRAFDASNLSRLLDNCYRDNEGLYPEPDEAMLMNYVLTVLNDGYVVVAEKSGRLIGTISVTNFQFDFAPDWYLHMDWFYVNKNFREGGVFDGLLTAIHAYADERYAPICGGISSGKDAILKDRLMGMKGYTYLGGQFLRERRQPESGD